jgi:hypothetical protein
VINSCVACQQSQPLYVKDRMTHIFAKKTNERFQIDMIDLHRWKNENDGNSYIMNVRNIFSKFCFAIPTKSKTMEEVCCELEIIFKCHGYQNIFQSDKGGEFSNNTMTELLKKYKVLQLFADLDTLNHKVKMKDVTRPYQDGCYGLYYY